MNYKDKYLKYKLKYLVVKKLYGGMESAEDFDLDTLEIPGAPEKQKLSNAIVDHFTTWYETRVSDSLKVYAANNKIFEDNIFNYKLKTNVRKLISHVYQNWNTAFTEVATGYPADFPPVPAIRDEQSKMTYPNLVIISMYYIALLATRELNKQPEEVITEYQQYDQQEVGEVTTHGDDVSKKLF